MVFEEIIRNSPRRRASPCIAEGFSPTARNADRIYFAISISPLCPSPAGASTRSGRASARCAPAPQGLPRAQGGLQPAAPQPRRGFHALREGFSPLRPSPAAGASMRSGRALARCAPAPQGLPRAQGGLQPAAPQPRRGFHALREGFSPLRPSPAAGASMRSGRAYGL